MIRIIIWSFRKTLSLWVRAIMCWIAHLFIQPLIGGKTKWIYSLQGNKYIHLPLRKSNIHFHMELLLRLLWFLKYGVVLSYYPELSASELKNVILDSGIQYNLDISKTSGKVNFEDLSKKGSVINAYNAIILAKKIKETTD